MPRPRSSASTTLEARVNQLATDFAREVVAALRSVPLSEIAALRTASQCEGELTVITNTTHTFGMTHPVDRITPGLVEMITHASSWLLQ